MSLILKAELFTNVLLYFTDIPNELWLENSLEFAWFVDRIYFKLISYMIFTQNSFFLLLSRSIKLNTKKFVRYMYETSYDW